MTDLLHAIDFIRAEDLQLGSTPPAGQMASRGQEPASTSTSGDGRAQ